jgi:uncharacterized membrane protein
MVNLDQSLWLDEAIAAQAVKNFSFLGLLANFAPGDFHPPLYYLLLKAWTNIFGYSEVVLRMPSVIFGAATVYFVYKIGTFLLNKQAGLVAALFLALNPLHIYYSQEARMYALATLAVTAASYFFLVNRWGLFIISFLVAVYTDYLPALMFPVFFVFAREKKRFILCSLFLILLFLPWLPVFATQLANGLGAASSAWGGILGQASVKNILLVPVKFIFGRVSLDNKIIYGAVAGVVLVLHTAILSRARRGFLWGWLAIPVVLGAVISLKIPTLSYFRYLFVLPAFCLLLGEGAKGKRAIMGFICLMSLMGLMTFHLSPRFWREDWRGAAAFMQKKPGIALLPSKAQGAPLDYYGQRYDDRPVFAERVYLLRYVQEIFDPQDKLRVALEDAGCQKTAERGFNGVLVWVFERR